MNFSRTEENQFIPECSVCEYIFCPKSISMWMLCNLEEIGVHSLRDEDYSLILEHGKMLSMIVATSHKCTLIFFQLFKCGVTRLLNLGYEI